MTTKRLARSLVPVALLVAASCAGPSQRSGAPELVLDQHPPGLRPALFAPGVVSTSEAVELNGVISPDGTEFFFTRVAQAPDGERVYRMHRCLLRPDGSWSAPEHVQVYPGESTSLAVDMAYSPDGDRLYFLGRHPHALSPEDPGLDIWVSERTEEGDWSLATPVPPPVWTEHVESYPALTPEGVLQFSSTRPGGFGRSDLWRAAPGPRGGFEEPVNLGPPVNTEHSERNSCVAPGDDYIVFDSNRPGGPGRAALYVSFRDEETGAWGDPILLGHGINTEDYEYCPMLSPDGRHLFFSRLVKDEQGNYLAGNVYWIDTAAITSLRPR